MIQTGTVRHISTGGYRIAYREANPFCRNTIFFFHGNSLSSSLWKYQLNDPLLHRYRMIAFDLPGHGQSDGTQHAYNVLAMGNLMMKAVETLAGEYPYMIAGLSLGTNLIGEMLGFPVYPSGIILISPTIVGDGIEPADLVSDGVSAAVLYQDSTDATLLSAYAAETLFSSGQTIRDEIIRDYQAVRPGFRPALKESIPLKLYGNEVNALKQYPHPVLCVVGEEDCVTPPALMQRAKLRYWGDKIHYLPGAGHLVPYDAPRLLTELIAAYAKEMFTDNRD